MVFLGGYKLNISSGNISMFSFMICLVLLFVHSFMGCYGESFSYILNADPFLLVPMLPILSPSW